MNEVVVKEQAPLDELMLAMDVVDTLRHKELMLAREVEADDREQRLLARLREIYTGQGIEVSDDVLKQGVAALQEERFSLQGPQPKLLALAREAVCNARAVGQVGDDRRGCRRARRSPASSSASADRSCARRRLCRASCRVRTKRWSPRRRTARACEGRAASWRDGKAQIDHHDLGKRARPSARCTRSMRSLRRAVRAEDRAAARRAQRRVARAGRQPARAQLLRDRRGRRAQTGRQLTMPIRSEEDGKTQRVSAWGLRVDEATFNKRRGGQARRRHYRAGRRRRQAPRRARARIHRGDHGRRDHEVVSIDAER